ncbi:MAG: hypothetical protein IPF92_19385 [Myxococcales bacterium]|nr:hypothetical protein [Myxococcales bacterium]
MSVYPYGDRKCGTTRLVKKSPEPSPDTLSPTLLELARRRLGLPSHATRSEIIAALNAHFTP